MAWQALSGSDATRDDATKAIALMASGGDARIVLDPATGLNTYMSAPYPRDCLAYASSTANDVSPAGFAHALAALREDAGSYGARLDTLRARIRAAYGAAPDHAIAFAPSGTDLEYVALAAVRGRGAGGVHNILLGADEVGSGCIHSAHGRYFARETARGIAVVPGEEVDGIGPVALADVAVRCGAGLARSSSEIADAIAAEAERGIADGRHVLVHVVHGSKTGLILPEMTELTALKTRFGDDVSFVIDACQARITPRAIAAYLALDAIIFLTGSKFMGGPPFSGFAILPAGLARHAALVPTGFAAIFRRDEWPREWPGRDLLPCEDNLGLWLRLEVSVFELERWQATPMHRIEAVIDAFRNAVTERIVTPLGLSKVVAYPPGQAETAENHPVAMRTLVTLDISSLPGIRSFADAQTLHRRMANAGIRLGQPVKSVRMPDGGWGGTLRIGLSMPQIAKLAQCDQDEAIGMLRTDMERIATAIRSHAIMPE
ncbi:hypothetical protein [Croceicoccus hydrothermalis]|uniref:hypothetical protein n=1 Tax=Croceicoccus hydrothermalis TaxID=2867964 RepID=UPI001EFB0D2B|nr:hypothetical protein [Croceicoccus hydrothermalis]